MLVIDADDHVAEHVDQPAIGVVGESLVAGRVRQADDGMVVQAEVENRVHHAGHRGGGAGADGDEQRIVAIAELLADLFLQHGDILSHVVHQVRAAIASYACSTESQQAGGDREAGRHRQADARHLGQVRSLAAEQRLLVAAAIGAGGAEVINHPLAAGFCSGLGRLRGRTAPSLHDGGHRRTSPTGWAAAQSPRGFSPKGSSRAV